MTITNRVPEVQPSGVIYGRDTTVLGDNTSIPWLIPEMG